MIRALIDLYILLLVVDVIISYIPQVKNHQISVQIRKLANYTCGPIREVLPKNQSFDFSTVIVIFLLNLLKVLW